MPTFGQYETAQRLHLTGVGALYALANDPAKVIKVLQPPPGIWSDDQLHDEVDAFLLRAKTQKKLAEASQNWAPVHEAHALRAGTEGSSGGGDALSRTGAPDTPISGAYSVLDRYERSARSLIDGRVNLNNDDLRNLMSGVFRGLADIRKSANRPHGNLKASNILLAQASDLAAATVHLADPAPDGALTPNSDKQDFADAGRLLYELVNLRPFQAGTIIGRSREWDRLGPNGADWRKLCNSLLDSSAPAEDRDLEKILAAVATWTAKPKKSKKPLVIAASVLLFLILGGGALYYLTRPPKLDFNQANWQKLCLSYYQWFGAFLDNFDDNEKKKFSTDPYPVEVVKLLNSAGSELDKYTPKNLARIPQTPLDLAGNPTDDAKTGYAPYYTKRGVELIDNISNALTPQAWPLLANLEATAKTYQDRGWARPAAAIRGIITAARPPPIPDTPVDIDAREKLIHPVDVFANIDITIKAAGVVAQIDSRWTRIEAQLKQLPDTDVPLLKALPKFAEDYPRSAVDPAKPPTLDDVRNLASSFDRIQQVLTQLLANLSGNDIVYSELAKDPGAQVPEGGAAKLTPDSFLALPELAKNYIRMKSDPRTALDWNKALDDVQKKFIDVIREANAQDTNLPALESGRAAVQQEVAAWAAIPAVEKNRREIEVLVAKARDDLSRLNTNAETWVAPYIIDPATYIAQQRAKLTDPGFPLARATPVVYAAWKTAHNNLLTKVAANPSELKKYTTYKAVDARFAALQSIYLDFDTKIPATVKGLSDLTGNDWRHTIAADITTTYRANALKDLMTNPALKWSDDLPQVEDPAYLSYARQRRAAFDQSCTDALALIADYSAIDDRLNHLQLRPADTPPGAKSWRDLYAAWRQSNNPLLSDTVITDALAPLTARLAGLLQLDAVTDYRQLVADAGSSAPEIALTAWRKLGAAPITQDLPVLDDEDKAESNLDALLTGLTRSAPPRLSAAQLNAFTAEIKAQRPIRWRRYAETLSSASAIQTALDRRASFQVTLSAQTDAAMLYDEALYSLYKQYTRTPPLTEAQLKPLAQNFIDNVGRMPAAQDPSVKDLLSRMAKSLTQAPEESSSSGAGPQLAGWEMDKPSPDVRIFYFPSKANPRHTLEFVKFQAGATQKTVFLCTSEMSFGLFADVVNASGKFADLDNAGKSARQQHWFKVSDDPWDGPRIWTIANRQFTLNSTWLFRVPQMANNPYYPANATPAPPAADLPMQYLSPWSALYVARLLGCRLPTSDEWKVAYEKFEADNAAAPRDAWNLRGAAWLTQFDYARKMAPQGLKYPDNGLFLTVDQLFSGITAESAKPWKAADLARLAPARITSGPDPYKGSVLWFRPVTDPRSATPIPGTSGLHDLVGNVAEYVCDGTADKPANAVIKDNKPTVAEIDAAIVPVDSADKRPPDTFVIGGSSLSPPETPFNQKQPVDPTFAQTATGFADVGFRLAYTAPIDSIFDVLASAFKEPHYLPGPKAKP